MHSILSSMTADFLHGFSGFTFIAPPFVEGNFSAIVPGLFSGTLTGMRCHPIDNNLCATATPLWEVNIVAHGDVFLSGFGTTLGEKPVEIFPGANMDFTGTATVVPEPSTILMIGSGLLGVSGLPRRKRKDADRN